MKRRKVFNTSTNEAIAAHRRLIRLPRRVHRLDIEPKARPNEAIGWPDLVGLLDTDEPQTVTQICAAGNLERIRVTLAIANQITTGRVRNVGRRGQAGRYVRTVPVW